MTTGSFYLLVISCILFAVRRSLTDHCSNIPISMQQCHNECSSGPCRVTVEQKTDQKTNGLSITWHVSVNHVSPSLPPGYIHLPNSGYYKYHPQLVPWLLAKDTCKEEGGHLLILNSEAEAKFVAANLPSDVEWIWIGTNDLSDEGVYVTIFNQTMEEAGYNKTYPGEPNGGVVENCGLMNKNSLLANGFCHLTSPFVCEIDLSD